MWSPTRTYHPKNSLFSSTYVQFESLIDNYNNSSQTTTDTQNSSEINNNAEALFSDQQPKHVSEREYTKQQPVFTSQFLIMQGPQLPHISTPLIYTSQPMIMDQPLQYWLGMDLQGYALIFTMEMNNQ